MVKTLKLQDIETLNNTKIQKYKNTTKTTKTTKITKTTKATKTMKTTKTTNTMKTTKAMKTTETTKTKRQRPKLDFNILTSGQFCTLAMFYMSIVEMIPKDMLHDVTSLLLT